MWVTLQKVSELHWPTACACCGAASDTTHHLRSEKAAAVKHGLTTTTTTYDAWDVPYCRICVSHMSAKERLRACIPACLIMLVLGWVMLGATNDQKFWGVLCFILAIGIPAFNFGMTRRKKASCPDLGVAVTFSSDPFHGEWSFIFKNEDYGKAFATSNNMFASGRMQKPGARKT